MSGANQMPAHHITRIPDVRHAAGGHGHERQRDAVPPNVRERTECEQQRKFEHRLVRVRQRKPPWLDDEQG